MSKHTPGPWEIRLRPFEDYPCVADEAGRVVCHVRGGFPLTPPRNEANARLIAAAPDLLAALEGLLEADIYADGEGLMDIAKTDTASGERAVAAARAAIAKAKGGEG